MRSITRSLTWTLLVAASLLLASSAAASEASARAHEDMKFGVKAAARGYWLEALTRFEEASKVDPNDHRILNNIAVALEAAGRYEQALVMYQRALAISPQDRVLQKNYKLFKEFYDENVAPPAAKEGADKGGPAGGEEAHAHESRH